jgi:hypothetical protein
MAFPAYQPKARVQKPAPHFSGTAVVDGTFEGESLSHAYPIQPTIRLPSLQAIILTPLLPRTQLNSLHLHQTMARPRLCPYGMDLRLPDRNPRV